MTNYPQVLDEFKTLDRVLNGESIARYGDGELKLCFDKNCIFQVAHPSLNKALRAILGGDSKCMVGIPNMNQTPKEAFWKNYNREPYIGLMKAKEYVSSFITRPDNAPWIDTPEYWLQVEQLWRGKDVVLVRGTEKSLRSGDLVGANSVVDIVGPVSDGFTSIGKLREAVLKTGIKTAILCLGPAATVLAAVLANDGIHAIDIGHIGMFMRHKGAFNFGRAELVDEEALKLSEHKGLGAKFRKVIQSFAEKMGGTSILDYGCGDGELRQELKLNGFSGYIGEYDPRIPEKSALPKPADIVACIDVLQYAGIGRCDSILDHIYKLAAKGCILSFETGGLPNKWWLDHIDKYPWFIIDTVEKEVPGKSTRLTLWLKK